MISYAKEKYEAPEDVGKKTTMADKVSSFYTQHFV